MVEQSNIWPGLIARRTRHGLWI